MIEIVLTAAKLHNFNILVDISSCPWALEALSDLIILIMLLSSIWTEESLLSVIKVWSSSILLLLSNRVQWGAKKQLKWSAFSLKFETSLSFIKNRGSLTSHVTSLFGVKFENILINVSLKIDNCLWTLLLLKIKFQLTDLINFLILLTSALLYSQTEHSYGAGYLMLRLSLQYVIWWWELECKDGWSPLPTIRFGWSVNIKSIQEEECGIRWVGCDMSWWNPCTVVRDSSFVPFVSVIYCSVKHQIFQANLSSILMSHFPKLPPGW